MDKNGLWAALLAELEAELRSMERAQKETVEAATHEEARPEDDKDTRALEQSYLARGQAMRLEELAAAVLQVRGVKIRPYDDTTPIGLTALVSLEDEKGVQTYLVAPAGGGALLDGGKVKVVTPKSPLGRALIGKQVGDEVEVPRDGRLRFLTVVALK